MDLLDPIRGAKATDETWEYAVHQPGTDARWRWREPIRNRWLFDFGLIACALVIPWALVFGALRGIPWWWRLLDCSFGVLGAVPLWLARRDAARLAAEPRS